MPLYGKEASDHTWRLEHIGDATGDEVWVNRLRGLEHEAQIASEDAANEAERAIILQRQLNIAKAEAEENKSKLREVEEELAQRVTELARMEDELSEKTAKLVEQQDALSQALELLASKERELSELHRTMHDNCHKISVRGDATCNSDMDKEGTISNMHIRGSQNRSTNPNAVPESNKEPLYKSPRKLTETNFSPTEVDQKLADMGWDSD